MLKFLVVVVNVALIRAALLGGWRDGDINDPMMKEIVDFAQTELNSRSNSMCLQQVKNVVSVKSQLVSGMNYKVTWKSESSGALKSSNLESSVCKFSNDLECAATIYVQFDGTKSLTQHNCHSDQLLFSKRAGGIREEKNLDQFNDIALRAVNLSNAKLQTSNIRVIKASTQVVAGMKYYLTITDSNKQCDLEIWSRPWVSGGEGFKVLKFECGKESKRALGGLRGGIKEEKNLDQFNDIALRAVSMSNAKLQTSNIRVIKARTQVVAGMKYYLTITDSNKQCELEIWSRPWVSGDEGFKVLKFECGKESKRALGGRAGGIKEETNLDQFNDIALRAVSLSNAKLDTSNIRVIKARTQVVAGMKYYLTITDSNKQCDLEIWSRAWVSGDEGFKVQKFDCGMMSERSLGGRKPGGVSEEKDNLDEYTDIITRAVSMSNADLKNVKLLSVRTQVVAGTNYFMKISALENGVQKTCDVAIWSRPWLSGDAGFQVTKFDC